MMKDKRICPNCGSEDVALGSGGVLRVLDAILTSEPEWFCKKCHHTASVFPIKTKIFKRPERLED